MNSDVRKLKQICIFTGAVTHLSISRRSIYLDYAEANCNFTDAQGKILNDVQ
jgi:hypothetical protein